MYQESTTFGFTRHRPRQSSSSGLNLLNFVEGDEVELV
jgi:hypothetical protein